jgi:hypothetical protein
MLLNPFEWVFPRMNILGDNTDYLDIPTPFICGMTKKNYDKNARAKFS